MFAAIGVGADRVSSRSYRHKDIVNRVMDDFGWVKARRRKPTITGYDNRYQVYVREGADSGIWWKYSGAEERFVEDTSVDSDKIAAVGDVLDRLADSSNLKSFYRDK